MIVIEYLSLINHQRRLRCHQFGFPLLLSLLIRNFLDSYQIKRSIENPNPGMPKTKKSNGLPPKTAFTPGTYNKNMKRIVSVKTPPNICLLNPE